VSFQLELDRFNDLRAKAPGQALTDAASADALETEVLPESRALRQRLAALQHLPKSLVRRNVVIQEDLRLREEAWELLVAAFRESDQQKVQQAMEKQKLADEALQRLSNPAGK
jgi:hypothetical protein